MSQYEFPSWTLCHRLSRKHKHLACSADDLFPLIDNKESNDTNWISEISKNFGNHHMDSSNCLKASLLISMEISL